MEKAVAGVEPALDEADKSAEEDDRRYEDEIFERMSEE